MNIPRTRFLLLLGALLSLSASAEPTDVERVESFLRQGSTYDDGFYRIAGLDFTREPLARFRDAVVEATRPVALETPVERYSTSHRVVAAIYLLHRLGAAGDAEERRLATMLGYDVRRRALRAWHRERALLLMGDFGARTVEGLTALVDGMERGLVEMRVVAAEVVTTLMTTDRARVLTMLTAEDLLEATREALTVLRREIEERIARYQSAEAEGADTRRETHEAHLRRLVEAQGRFALATGAQAAPPAAAPGQPVMPGLEAMCLANLRGRDAAVVGQALHFLERMSSVLGPQTLEALLAVAATPGDAFAEARSRALVLLERQTQLRVAQAFARAANGGPLDGITACVLGVAGIGEPLAP